jgi:hypothetical protein
MEINIKTFGRGISAPIRSQPNFIIIGAQKSGTTSLYSYLTQHPCVLPSFRKELNFFDLGYQRGMFWYQSYFPTKLALKFQALKTKERTITGEATPQYLFHPLAPQRVWETLPEVKLIVLLRNPVTRAYSHYNHVKSRGLESLSFEDALAREESIIASELEKLKLNPNYRCLDLLNHSYVSRGIYVEQLERWFKFFPRDKFLISKYEDFTNNPKVFYKNTLDFLGLPDWELINYESFNSGNYSSSLKAETKNKLLSFFESHNQRLYDLLETDFGW